MSITVTHLLSTSAGRRQMVHTGRVEPSADDIRLQLDRIVGSSMFANADRMTSFLRFVVERALAGEGDQLKEYVVGVAVFGRTDDYDPRLDSIVRVEARRLRTKLDEYLRRRRARRCRGDPDPAGQLRARVRATRGCSCRVANTGRHEADNRSEGIGVRA